MKLQIRVGNTDVVGSSEDELLCQNQVCYMLGNDDTVKYNCNIQYNFHYFFVYIHYIYIVYIFTYIVSFFILRRLQFILIVSHHCWASISLCNSMTKSLLHVSWSVMKWMWPFSRGHLEKVKTCHATWWRQTTVQIESWLLKVSLIQYYIHCVKINNSLLSCRYRLSKHQGSKNLLVA